MRLARVTVTNYRSILAAESFDVADYTVLIGPNNEGKSNLLRAMVLGLETIHNWSLLRDLPPVTGADHMSIRTAARRGSVGTLSERRIRQDSFYSWERDYPLTLQSRAPGAAASRVRLDFQLDESEVESFRATVGSYNNGRLPVELLFSPRTVKFAVIKQGPGAKALASKSKEIAAAIASSLQMVSVPTARTESNVLSVIQALVSRQLNKLNDLKAYRDAASQLDSLRADAIRELQDSMRGSLTEYLPDMSGVEIVVASVAEQSMRVEDLFVDDGVNTSISEKGDGVKSLTAISLMQQAARDASASLALIAAIDEPEAHLHPEAIHKLKTKLLDIAKTQQVIISTHAPVLVNRGVVGANIVVSGNRARAAKSLSEVRLILGVRLADNLSHAELVLLVEGTSDEQALRELLASKSRPIRRAIQDSSLTLIAIRGASRLHTELLSQRNNVCRAFVILDGDDPAQTAVKKEIDAGLLTAADYFLFSRPGGNCELEDLYLPMRTIDAVSDYYGLTITASDLAARNRKWSVKVRTAVEARGKIVDESDLTELKMRLARSVAADPLHSMSSDGEAILENLISQVERKLTDIA